MIKIYSFIREENLWEEKEKENLWEENLWEENLWENLKRKKLEKILGEEGEELKENNFNFLEILCE